MMLFKKLRRLAATVGIVLLLISTSGCAHLRHRPAGAVLLDGIADSRDVSRELWKRGWSGFHSPNESSEQMGLTMVGGYQPGKIPVVFIHGLLSDRLTWKEVIDELRTDPGFSRYYQVWAFYYPTGVSYFQSAAELRGQLVSNRTSIDPQRQDRALDQMVLVGHSMGGLIAKLQITHSDDHIWSAVSDRPFDEVAIPDDDKQRLAAMLFFEPNPSIKRVVFIATPHGGSRWTERPLGKLARKFVQFPEDMRADFQRLVPDNGLLLREVPKRIPTSVDHLSPDSDELKATQWLPLAPGVHLHSIIGIGHRLPDFSKGDGVVSIDSAHFPNADSELAVDSYHTSVHRNEESIAELKRILIEHFGDTTDE